MECQAHSLSGVISLEEDIQDMVLHLSKKHLVLPEVIVAHMIRTETEKDTPLSRLLQFVLDSAGDQFISEEFYFRHKNLLHFLDLAGCGEETVRFLAYVDSHPDIFRCRRPGCEGRIVGECPIMLCDKCRRSYYLHVEGLSDLVCNRCVSHQIKTCPVETRRKRHVIYAV